MSSEEELFLPFSLHTFAKFNVRGNPKVENCTGVSQTEPSNRQRVPFSMAA
jgi:hypothetical protein